MNDGSSSEIPCVSEEMRRQLFLETVNAAYATLRQDPKLWQEELEERAIWGTTLADGLELRK